MRTLKAIVGLPVLQNGVCIGYALGGEADIALRKLESVLITARFGGARRVSREDVLRIGEVAIHTDSCGKRVKGAPEPLFRRAISTDGARLGAIVDAELDDRLNIAALWLSCSYPDDLLSGRRKITRYSVRERDGVVLIPTGEEDMG